MKRTFFDKVNKVHFFLMIPIVLINIGFLIKFVLRPGIPEGFWLLIITVLCVLNVLWMQKGIFEDRADLNKRIREWDHNRKVAAKKREPFDQPKPVKSKMLTPNIYAVIAIFIGVFLFMSIPLKLIDAMAPHGKYVYYHDIKELKEKSSRYEFFPSELPKSAKHVRWTVFPSVMQGDGYEFLRFEADPEFIAGQLDRYCKGVHPQNGANLGFGDCLNERERMEAEVYVLYDNGDWNHQRYYGIGVVPSEDLIFYFLQ